MPTAACDKSPVAFDAVMIPKGYVGGDEATRRPRTFELLEGLLGLDYDAGQRAWAREQPGGTMLFVTADPEDTLHHPDGHPRAGRPRYEWSDGERGIRLGRLIPDA